MKKVLTQQILTTIIKKGSWFDLLSYIFLTADNPKVLDPRQRQALLDLIFFVLYHFFQMSMTGDEEEKMAKELLAKEFLDFLVCFQQQLPMDDFIKHPGLLLFVAKCLLNIDWSKEEENDFLEVAVNQVERSIIFLTG